MNWTNISGILAMFSSFACALGDLHQLIKIIRRKSAKDVSIPMCVTLAIAALIWLWYGSNKSDVFLIITNIIYSAVFLPLLFFAIKYRKEG